MKRRGILYKKMKRCFQKYSESLDRILKNYILHKYVYSSFIINSRIIIRISDDRLGILYRKIRRSCQKEKITVRLNFREITIFLTNSAVLAVE